MTTPWASNWCQRFRSIVNNLGCEDTFSFVMSRKRESFGAMFGALREAANESDRAILAIRQFEEVFYMDAEENGQFREAFMEALVRNLNQYLRKGWNRGRKLKERRIDARHRWPVPSLVTTRKMSYKQWEELQARIWEELQAASPPDDWCPSDYSDPIIQDVFNRSFPKQ